MREFYLGSAFVRCIDQEYCYLVKCVVVDLQSKTPLPAMVISHFFIICEENIDLVCCCCCCCCCKLKFLHEHILFCIHLFNLGGCCTTQTGIMATGSSMVPNLSLFCNKAIVFI